VCSKIGCRRALLVPLSETQSTCLIVDSHPFVLRVLHGQRGPFLPRRNHFSGSTADAATPRNTETHHGASPSHSRENLSLHPRAFPQSFTLTHTVPRNASVLFPVLIPQSSIQRRNSSDAEQSSADSEWNAPDTRWTPSGHDSFLRRASPNCDMQGIHIAGERWNPADSRKAATAIRWS
jgi:hypothetical protein